MSVTAEQMAALAAQGSYWYMRPNGEFYALNEYVENDDLYLLTPTPAQLERWSADWNLGVEDLSPMFAVLDEYRS